MSKLVIVNDNKLGSRPVMVKSAARSNERAAVSEVRNSDFKER